MAATPVVVPQAGHTLQISPNLEALLQHDELTRRSTGSPTNAHYTPTSPEYSISLPPPPPRKARKPPQEPFPAMRTKEGQRRRGAALSTDFWPDALPATPTDNAVVGPPPSASSDSRPVTPNPYLNPTPIVQPIHMDGSRASPQPARLLVDISVTDQAPTPRPSAKTLPAEPTLESAADSGPRASAPDASHRPSRNKVEKILWMGRDSLSLFSGSANGLRRLDSDRRNDRADDAVQGNPILLSYENCAATMERQVPVAPGSRSDTATPVSSSSRPAAPYLCLVGSSETISTSPASPELPPTRDPHPVRSPHPSRRLPRLSLPSSPMSRNPSSRPQGTGSLTAHDNLSFIDLVSPPTSDEANLCNIQATSASRRHLQPINTRPSSLYSTSRHNLSSSSLASMKFAPPPSPTTMSIHEPSPTYRHSPTSSSSATLSSMVFAPPSPSSGRIPPTRLQPLSGPPSPYSPLEFAPPPSPTRTVDPPSPPATPEVVSCDRTSRFKPKKRSKSSSPYTGHHSHSSLPPTTNQLDANERADRIRRNRKLTRVFGRTPGKEDSIDADEPRLSKKLHASSLAALLTKQRNHRHAMSVSVSVKAPGMKTEPSTPWQTDGLWSADGRRHSTPLTGSFTLYMDDDQASSKDPYPSRNAMDATEVASTRSFIDLSDEEIRDDDASAVTYITGHPHPRRRLHQSNSTPSLVDSLDLETQAELERRRKRERLARLHRFLGSRVPLEAVIGSVYGPPLPPPASEDSHQEHQYRGNKNAHLDGFDQCKEELDEREKALNVRRAQKMEKVFGAPPPQTLFHTRLNRPAAPASQPVSPSANPFVLTLDIPSYSRNPNQSAYVGKTLHRQGPSDSSRCLLSRKEDTPDSSPSSFAQSFADSFAGPLSGFQEVLAQSSVYLNYQHSLNSLIDIIDRDDRRSLFELHRFLHGEANASSEEEEVAVNARRASIAASCKSERRHSLPSNASMTSLSSEFYASPETIRFQSRRRKAAKLTHFFGVDYRELIHDILESIEKGVEDEHIQGTLHPQEVEVLMHRVRSLRSMNVNDPFSG